MINIATHSLSLIFCRSSEIIKSEVLCEGIRHRECLLLDVCEEHFLEKKNLLFIFLVWHFIRCYERKETFCKSGKKKQLSEYQVPM